MADSKTTTGRGSGDGGAGALDGLRHDLKYAARTLARSPGFTVVAVLTLALGIGANTAIFSLVDGVLLRPLPYEDSDEIVRVMERNDRYSTMAVAWPNYVDWREQTRTLESLGAYASFSSTILGGDRPVQETAAMVSRGFFDVLGVSPVRGPGLGAEDHREGADPAAVVSHAFWRDVLGAPEELAGRTVETGAFTFRVVGVMPPGFDFPAGTSVWFPAELRIFGETSRTAHNYRVVGRLADGAAAAGAQDELTGIIARANAGNESDYAGKGATLMPLRNAVSSSAREPLLLLLGASALLLLVACSNLASTFLARARTREREMAVRASLGAGRGRIVRQLFTEALTLSVAGAAAGLLLAYGVIRSLTTLAPAGTIPRLEGVGLDPRVLAFTAAVTVLTAVLFGLLPAVRASRADVTGALRSGRRGSSGGDREGVWRLIVGGEAAMALILLVGSGLLIRSFQEVLSVDPGFDTREVVTVDANPPATRFGEDPLLAGYYRDLRREVGSIPGVEDVGIVANLPLGAGISNGQIHVEGGPEPAVSGRYQAADAGYFRVMEIPLLRGRLFDERDDADAEHVAVVSRSFAELAWPGEDPIGKRITGGGMDTYVDPDSAGPASHPWVRWARVVGVVGDVRHRTLTEDPAPTYYFHYLQRPQRMLSGHVVAKAAGDPAGLATPIRTGARRVSPDVVVDVRLMDRVVQSAVGDRRFTMLILGAFGLSALLLAGVGIYGVVSYSVARRKREMGIRIALGAQPRDVRTLVQRGALVTVGVGTAVGLLGALGLGSVVRSLLYGISATDPLTYGAVAATLVATAWLASWIPARRSTRVDPMRTMRAE